MKIIGITGQSGAGKTTLTEMIKNNYNLFIIDADEIARKLSNDSQTEYFKQIINLFGNEILEENGKLDRPKIASIIYTDTEKREALNRLTFKYIGSEIKNRIEIAKQEKYDYIVLDVPLLYEAGLEDLCDYVIAIVADYNNKISRICERDNISDKVAKQRLEIQKDNAFFEEKADFVIYNNKGLEELENSLKEIIEKKI